MAHLQSAYDPTKSNPSPESFTQPQTVQTVQTSTQRVVPSDSTHPQMPPPQAGNPYQYRTSHSVPLDFGYIKHGVGMLSLTILLHSFIALLVMVCSNNPFNNYLEGAYGFYLFACVSSFLVSGAVAFIGTTQLPQESPSVPWALMMTISFGMMAFFELIASSLVAARAVLPRDGACAVLGFIVFQAYIACLVISIPDAIKQTGSISQMPPPQREQRIEYPPSYLESTQHHSQPISNPTGPPTFG